MSAAAQNSESRYFCCINFGGSNLIFKQISYRLKLQCHKVHGHVLAQTLRGVHQPINQSINNEFLKVTHPDNRRLSTYKPACLIRCHVYSANWRHHLTYIRSWSPTTLNTELYFEFNTASVFDWTHRHENIWEIGSMAPRILNMLTTCSSGESFTLRPPTLRGRSSLYPLQMRVDGLNSRSGHFGEETQFLDSNCVISAPTRRLSPPPIFTTPLLRASLFPSVRILE